LDVDALSKGLELSEYGLKTEDVSELSHLFEHATAFGSLIQVPEELAKKLSKLRLLSEAAGQDLFVSKAVKCLGLQVDQAQLLAAQYDAVVANPPYMGSKIMPMALKSMVKDSFPSAVGDLYAAFLSRSLTLCKPHGAAALVTMQGWMFLSTMEPLRRKLLMDGTVHGLAHLGARAFGSISGEVVQTAATVVRRASVGGYRGAYIDSTAGSEADKRLDLAAGGRLRYDNPQSEFEKIPGSPVAYWVSGSVRELFASHPAMQSVVVARQGLKTGDNERFLRRWQEVAIDSVGLGLPDRDAALASGKTWFPCNKGGEFRRWAGNHEFVVEWSADGSAIRSFGTEAGGRPRSRVQNSGYYFQQALSWSDIGSGKTAFRVYPQGFISESTGMCAFDGPGLEARTLVAYCNTPIVDLLAGILNPTLHFNTGDFERLPVPVEVGALHSTVLADRLVSLATSDWDAYERSWRFESLPLLTASSEANSSLESSSAAWVNQNQDTIAEMKRLEEVNNRLFIDAYGLTDELIPDVPIEQITLTVNPAYRYGGKLTEEEQWTRFRQDTMEELVSYAIGCMMGRYSLDEPGLIYAHSGNEGFDPSRYTTFPADEDGIVPITDAAWFEDDAGNRVVEFVSVAWDAVHLEENLAFLADNLSPKKNESSRDTIRRYLCDRFFKDHLQTYKKRPIYWLFSSGKQKAFQCLVYLHRYNPGTLSRIRSEYVIPLQGKFAARLDQLQGDIQVATSTAHQKRLEKELVRLQKQQVELLAFDEKLRHYADQRIALDLDDGVKVNYGKFGDLLAEVKGVAGSKKGED
jgi:hypothetical protein